MEDKKSFFKERMDLLGVTEENNVMWIENPDAEHPEPRRRQINVFQEDKDGNIRINYWDLNRQVFNWVKMGSGKMSHVNGKRQEWYQLRLKEPKNDRKYDMPGGQGSHPFLPPRLVEMWERKEKIETIYLTEGAFKAWLAMLYGIPTVGLTSITHYRDKETDRLHHDIERIILDCEVQNVVILWDGDCLDISENQLFDKVELTKRPFGFFNSAKKIKEKLEELELPEGRDKLRIYFYHVRSESMQEQPKGLDDLLIAAHDNNKVDAVVSEIGKVNQAKPFFFHKQNITSSTNTLYQYFRLNSADQFYAMHADIIRLNEFVFRGNIYRWEEGKNKLELISPEWAKNIKWIGDDFFKLVEKPSASGDTQLILEKRKKQTLADLCKREHGENDFLKFIEYYEGFCNVPDHFNYKQTHGKFYNRYHPFRWVPKPGKLHYTIDFIKHIFGDREIKRGDKVYRSWQLGLDYVQLLLTQPTHILPVLILFSPENNTGKSTFGKWLRLILGHNSIQIGNQDFKSDFNDHWADKLLAICEETLLDRKKDVEPIKAYATSNKITVNPKGFARFEIDFFCKFQFYSNNPRMIYVSKHDERFWIIQVPVPKKDNPNMLESLKAEIPAFLDFIINRELVTERESRMWFHPSLIRTDTFFDTVKVNEPTDAQDLREKIKEMFIDFNKEEILMPMKHINSEFFGGRGRIRWIKELLQDYLNVDKLRDENGRIKQVRGSYQRWEKAFDDDGTEYLREMDVRFNDRPYVFHRADFVESEEEVESVTDENDPTEGTSKSGNLF